MSHAKQIEALKGLLEKACAAEGPDRRLDAEIVAGLTGGRVGELLGCYWTSSESHQRASFVTSSIDAAFSLARYTLPEWDADLHRSKGGFCIVSMTGPNFCDADMRQYAESGVRPTGGLAVCEALLSAKLALLTQEAGDAE